MDMTGALDNSACDALSKDELTKEGIYTRAGTQSSVPLGGGSPNTAHNGFKHTQRANCAAISH